MADGGCGVAGLQGPRRMASFVTDRRRSHAERLDRAAAAVFPRRMETQHPFKLATKRGAKRGPLRGCPKWDCDKWVA